MIIDFHAHVWPDSLAERAGSNVGEYYNIPVNCIATYDGLVKTMADNGADKSVIFSVATSKAQVAKINDFLNSFQSDKIIVFGAMHHEFADYKAEICRMKKMGFKGIKFHPDFQGIAADDIRLMRIYEEIGDEMIILHHAGDKVSDFSAPKRFANILDQMPHLRMVAAHLGGYQRWEDSINYLCGRDIYFDTSSCLDFMSHEKFLEIIRLHGSKKVLFGTDFPLIEQKDEIARLKNVGLTDEELADVLGENAKRLLNIK